MVTRWLEWRFGVLACLLHRQISAANSHCHLLGVPLPLPSKRTHPQGRYRKGSRSRWYRNRSRRGIHHRCPSIVLPKIHLGTLHGVLLDGLLSRVSQRLRTGGKVRNRLKNATVAVQCSWGGDASRRFSTRKRVEFGVDKCPGENRIVQGIQQGL
jgi:hypothetical protein